ncbi:uncharacterized protein PV09_06651 [Verruconis gallopava]|uniref:F-box domain-containing protein n=1 Tax=Verruconis gallopava TaxID=253628 RepID=A0A0D2A5H1_9PEZI|nr:uncharacterized protein PV09_06651 [Verruconis gallopava]KIW01795.1 hypothetical protein PV09_06651 [Verruconis gallopava]
MASSETASTRLFRSPELVDLVFEHLNKQSLFQMQYVCRFFNSRIKHVKSLRRKLFLYADQSEIIDNRGNNTTRIHSLKLNPFLYSINAGHKPHDDDPDSVLCRLPFPQRLVVSPDTSIRWAIHRTCFLLFVPASLKHDVVVKASYRDMYLTQPPVTRVLLYCPDKVAIDRGGIADRQAISTPLDNDAGIKVGDVIDAILEYADREYLRIAPYAIQVVYSNLGEDGRKLYKTLVEQHYFDWKAEFGLGRTHEALASDSEE